MLETSLTVPTRNRPRGEFPKTSDTDGECDGLFDDPMPQRVPVVVGCEFEWAVVLGKMFGESGLQVEDFKPLLAGLLYTKYRRMISK